MEGLLELGRYRHRLFAGFAQLALIGCGYSGATRQCFDRLEVFEALFAAFPRTKRFVFPAAERLSEWL